MVREIRAFFSIHAETTAETSEPQAPPTDDWCAINMAIPVGLQWPWEKFGSATLSWKKKQVNFVDTVIIQIVCLV